MKPSEVLIAIKRNPWKMFKRVGICRLYNQMCVDGDGTLLLDMLRHRISQKDFPLYSGDSIYPVYSKTPDDAERSFKTLSKWNPFSRYGRNRRAYLNWLIEEFEKRGA